MNFSDFEADAPAASVTTAVTVHLPSARPLSAAFHDVRPKSLPVAFTVFRFTCVVLARTAVMAILVTLLPAADAFP